MDDRELLERIDRSTASSRELTDAVLAVLREILATLHNMNARLDDLRDIGESHSQTLLRILDRLGPGPDGAAA